MVSCPNYAFEILAWVTISLMTGSIAGELFEFVAPMSQQNMNTFFFRSLALYRRRFRDHGCLGRQEAQELQERIWSVVSQC